MQSFEVRHFFRQWWLECKVRNLTLCLFLFRLFLSFLSISFHSWWQFRQGHCNKRLFLNPFVAVILLVVHHRFIKWNKNLPWYFLSTEWSKISKTRWQISHLLFFFHCLQVPLIEIEWCLVGLCFGNWKLLCILALNLLFPKHLSILVFFNWIWNLSGPYTRL